MSIIADRETLQLQTRLRGRIRRFSRGNGARQAELQTFMHEAIAIAAYSRKSDEAELRRLMREEAAARFGSWSLVFLFVTNFVIPLILEWWRNRRPE